MSRDQRNRLARRALRLQRELVWLERHSARFPVTYGPVAAELNTELQDINRRLAEPVTRSA